MAARASDLLFFLSGVASLGDQVVWSRLLGRALGADAAGVAIVLAVFMGGLGLGAALCGPLARRTRTPRRAFLLVQLGVAAWTAISPELLDALPRLGDGALARIVAATAMLLVPTTLMGATFPLMGRLTARDEASAAADVARFYGANTLGAALGALLGPFAIMPTFGLSGALRFNAVLDATAGVGAYLLLRDAPPLRAGIRGAPAPARAPLAAAFLLGFAALAYEVVATRILVTLTGASVHAFAIVLGAFLAGLGLGSRWTKRPSERALRRCALAATPLALAGLVLLERQVGEASIFAPLSNRMPAGASVLRLWLLHALLAVLALVPCALAFGAALPCAVAAVLARDRERSLEAALARVYAWNTAGALLGTLCAAFVLLPRWGPFAATIAGLAAAPLAGMLVGGQRERRATLVAIAVTALLALVLAPPAETGATRRWVGTFSTASVHDSPSVTGAAPVRSLRVDGKVVATTAPVDLRLQRLLGLIPALLHGEVESALCIGLGTGMTAGALLALPELRTLELVEISPAVVAAAREFDAWNGALLGDPRTHLVVGDGRARLAAPDGARFDLVTADPIHPWTRGSSDLYSREHFGRMAERLAPGGIASQWLPLYQLSSADVRTIVATWCDAFAHTSAWLTAYDLALVGANEPPADPRALAAREIPPAVAALLSEACVGSAAELAALRVADDARLRAFAAGEAPMHDDLPLLEFRAPRSFLAGYSVDALRWAASDASAAGLPERSTRRAHELHALLTLFLDELPSGWSAAAERYGERLCALPPLEE